MIQPILRASALRSIEAENATSDPPLMERAGACAARIAQEMLAGASQRVLIVAGPGNNGGDAFVVARLLKAAGHAVHVLSVGDPDRLPADARQAHDAWRAAGGSCSADYPPGDFALIVDGLFGIGLTRPVEGSPAQWIERMNAGSAPILALDVPSGLDAGTGRLTGPTVRATRTATFIALKPGLLTGNGPDRCGQITVCTLGLAIGTADGLQIAPELFSHNLKSRPRNSHKGRFGSAAIIGGAPGMAGATLLAGRTALRLGAGRVYLGMLDRLAIDAASPELMLRTPADAMAQATALAIGPGLGLEDQAAGLLRQAIDSPLPLVIDADGLNLLAQDAALSERIAVRPAPTFADAASPAPTVLTPHPAEAARLLGCATAAIESDRLAAASELARRFNACVALKGCGTIITAPDGRWFINATGNPGLATAGSGDVLTGMLVALLAQSWPPLEALLCAVHLHGAAADACVAAGAGPIGLTAGELVDPARRIFNRWSSHLDV